MMRARELAMRIALTGCTLASVLTTVGIIYVLITEALFAVPPEKAFFQDVSPREFFTSTQWTPQYEDKHFGILPLLAGTFLVAGIAAMIGLPIGLAGAIYLSEYASRRTRNMVMPILEILAGIPTVVYGYFALVFVTPYFLRPIFQGLLGIEVNVFNAASAGIVVGIMIIPIVTSLSEDALRSVPGALREAAFALGATKYQVSAKVVVPAALSGVLASFLLAISRAVGETMAVAIAAGQSPTLTLNPFQSVETMTAFIVNVSFGDKPHGSLEWKALFAVAIALFTMTLAMNVVSHLIMRRFREAYQ
jgi:phosphate transport system permease protein